MKYAIIRINKKQYKVSEGDEISLDQIDPKEVQAEVLYLNNEGKIQIGKPVLEKVKIKIKILGDEKGDKLKIAKYKAKSKYRKKIGFRPSLTKLLIEKID